MRLGRFVELVTWSALTTSPLCDLKKVTCPLWAAVSLSETWGKEQYLFQEAVERTHGDTACAAFGT